MQISNVHVVTYSPTGTTTRNVSEIAAGMGLDPSGVTDLTLPADGRPTIRLSSDTLTLIGAPVYAGQVAPEAVARFQSLSGDQSPAVVVAVYGNRHYDNGLKELAHTAEQAGFVVIGAAAVVGEHSYSTPEMPIGNARPDAQDLSEVRDFGRRVLEKATGLETGTMPSPLKIPGVLPDGPYPGPSGICPEVDAALCTGCTTCASVCPTGAMTVDEGKASADPASCTFCCACLKSCPESAIMTSNPRMLSIRQMLFEKCQKRREPEFFL